MRMREFSLRFLDSIRFYPFFGRVGLVRKFCQAMRRRNPARLITGFSNSLDCLLINISFCSFFRLLHLSSFANNPIAPAAASTSQASFPSPTSLPRQSFPGISKKSFSTLTLPHGPKFLVVPAEVGVGVPVYLHRCLKGKDRDSLYLVDLRSKDRDTGRVVVQEYRTWLE